MEYQIANNKTAEEVSRQQPYGFGGPSYGYPWMGCCPWMGQQWHGQPWMGQQWHGQPWMGQQWHGQPWMGQQWHGQPWMGQQWHGWW